MRATSAGVTPSTRASSPTVSNGAFAGLYVLPGGAVVGFLGAVGALQVVGVAPVEDRGEHACRPQTGSSPPTFCSRPFSSGSLAVLRSMRDDFVDAPTSSA